ncbi:MAG TPA: hypothetical protein VI685_23555 [Candidatus Angelobacter sp.]
MPLIESKPQGKNSFIKFELDSDTRQLLTFYCEFSHNKKPDPVIVGALKMLFKADSDFGPWVEQKKRQLANEKPATPSSKPATTKTETAEGKRNS